VRSIVVDAGPMIAMFDRADAHHAQAGEFLRRTGECRLITTSVVIGEVAAMLSDVPPSLFRILDWPSAVVEIDDAFREDLPRTIEIMKKHSNLPADLADVSLVALCERRSVSTIASIDSDFDVYRLPRSRKFENVFFKPGSA
jgi:predicted nucleic acid-binding protein